MNVLFPFVGDSVGGSHKSAIILIQSLMLNGVNARIVLHMDNGPLARYLKLNKLQFDILDIKYIAGTSPKLYKIAYGILVSFLKIYVYIRKNNITLVHANDLRINLTWSIPVRFTSTKFVWHQRTLLSSSYFWRFIPYFSDYLIAISETVYSTIPLNVPISKKKLIHNPINVDSLYNTNDSSDYVRKKYQIRSDCTLLGYVGRLTEKWKRVDFLISCFSSFSEDNYHLLIVGDCESEYSRYLKKIAFDMKIGHKITFTGFIPDPTLLISSFDILIAPSCKEPFGRVLLESMSQKTVVLASNSGGHIDILSTNNGYLFKMDDCHDLENKIKHIERNGCLVEKTIEKAYFYVKSQFSPSSHMDKILKLYRQL